MSSETKPNLGHVLEEDQETDYISHSEAREIIKGWAQIKLYLPKNFNPHHMRFLRDYFRAQLAISKGKREKAKKIFRGLTHRTGYTEFEEKNETFLAAIDIAVRGETRWNAQPAFKIRETSNGKIS